MTLRSTLVAAMLAAAASHGSAAAGPEAVPAAPSLAVRQQVDLNGIDVEFTIRSLEGEDRPQELRENQLVRVRFKVSDGATGTPLSGVFPAAWMDRLPHGEVTDAHSCLDKVEMFLGGSLRTRAELDLNVYYVVTMNGDATLSVVDPLFGFGGTKLLATVPLWSQGRDWVLSKDRTRIFVSMPAVDSVAVVETQSWQVTTNIPTAPSPQRMVLQPDGVYLWVGFDQPEAGQRASGVAVIQPANLAQRTRIVTGRGHHEIAVSSDNRFAFVTNAEDGTVSVIDVRKLAVVETIETAARPGSITWSEAAQAVYVAHEESGTITAIDAGRLEIVARMSTQPGLGQIRAAPGGRLIFAVNPVENLLHIIDTSSTTVVQTGPMAAGPDQITFSDTLAYIRHRGHEEVLMVPLAEVGRAGAPIPVVDFPGGQRAPGERPATSLAPAIVRAPGANAVLVANPADGMVYYYMEGMAAPTGAFKTYSSHSAAVLAVDNSLRERAPGHYETTARLRRPGRYDVVFFLEAPRSVHCFPVVVEASPELARMRQQLPLHVRALGASRHIAVIAGEEAHLIVEVTDPATGEVRAGLSDLEIMAMLAPGRWHTRRTARGLGDGRYEVRFRPPREGLYYLYAECASAGLGLGERRPLAYVVATDPTPRATLEDPP